MISAFQFAAGFFEYLLCLISHIPTLVATPAPKAIQLVCQVETFNSLHAPPNITMASDNTENQPPQTPLSPPDSTRKPITRSAIHAFFTPRHRAPLGEVSGTSSTRNVSGLVGTPTPAGSVAFAKNFHLLSPEDSPSNRASKKARRVLFPASEEKNESGREVLFAPISGAGAVKGKKLFPGNGKIKAKAGEGVGDIFDEVKEEEQVVKERPNRVRPTGRNRVLMRILGTGSMTGMRSTMPHHCAGKIHMGFALYGLKS